MAQYVPEGWRCSPQAKTHFTKNYRHISNIVQLCARKFFALASISSGDLHQEGLIAALYAIDSYQPERGKLDAYMTILVNNALAMIAAESRALCRQPHAYVRDEWTGETEWVRVPVTEYEEPDTILTAPRQEITAMAEEEEMRFIKNRVAARKKLAALRNSMSAEAAQLFDVKVSPPVELLVMARNLTGRTMTERTKVPVGIVQEFTNIRGEAMGKALQETRKVLRNYNVSSI